MLSFREIVVRQEMNGINLVEEVTESIITSLKESEWKDLVLVDKKQLKSRITLNFDVEHRQKWDRSRGDLSFPCFGLIKLPKSKDKNASKKIINEVAQHLAESLKKLPYISDASVLQGFVNLFLDLDVLAEYFQYFLAENAREVFSAIAREVGAKKDDSKNVINKIIIEHTSVNPGKPYHIGHARNAILGDTLARVFRALGKDVEVQNYIDNLGRQVAVTFWGQKRYKELAFENPQLFLEIVGVDSTTELYETLKTALTAKQIKKDLLHGLFYIIANMELEFLEYVEKIKKEIGALSLDKKDIKDESTLIKIFELIKDLKAFLSETAVDRIPIYETSCKFLMDESFTANLSQFKKWLKEKYTEILRIDTSPIHEVEMLLKHIEHEKDQLADEARKFALESLHAQLKTAWRLGVDYDVLIWESDVVRSGMLDEALKLMLKSNRVFKVTDGVYKDCIVLDYHGYEKQFGIPPTKVIDGKKIQLPPYKVLIRSNGTSTYIAKDIAYQMWKFGVSQANFTFRKLEFNHTKRIWSTWSDGVKKMEFGSADHVINVIGSEQARQQQLVYLALKIMGFEREYQNSYHLSYASVELPGERFSGRRGNWLHFYVDRILDKTASLLEKEVEERNPNAAKKEIKAVTQSLTITAFRYFMLKYNAATKIVFRYEDALNWQGNSGIFVLYTAVRINSIFKKLEERQLTVNPTLAPLTYAEEMDLLKLLILWPLYLEKTAKLHDPSLLIRYLHEVARAFNVFYNNHRILDAPDEVRNARVGLCLATKNVMEYLFSILNFTVPSFM